MCIPIPFFALVTSGAGLVSIVEGAELAVPGFPHPAGAASDVEPNVVVVRGAVDRAAVDLLPGSAELVVPVDLVLVDFMQDRDLAAVKAELTADPIQGFIISHVAGRPAINALGQLRIFGLGDVLRELVWLPFQLPVNLGLEESQPALILSAAL